MTNFRRFHVTICYDLPDDEDDDMVNAMGIRPAIEYCIEHCEHDGIVSIVEVTTIPPLVLKAMINGKDNEDKL